MKKTALILIISMLFITACSHKQEIVETTSTPDITTTATEEPEETETVTATETTSNEDNEMFSDRDYEVGFIESECVKIECNGTTATSTSDSVKIDGSTITITEEATYLVSGTLNDGMLVVNTDDTAKLQIVFDGANITSKTSAPLYILEADKVFLTLAPDSKNYLSNGGEFEAIDDNNIDGAIFSKQDLTINGSGSLEITSPAGHGIVCKDDLVITSGTYIIASASHGMDANDSVRLANASITIDAGKDGIHSENDDDSSLGFVYIESGTYSIEAEGDGIASASYMTIENGSFDITTGGGSVNSSKQSSDNYGGFMGGGGHHGASQMDYSNSTSDDSTSIKALKSTGDIIINGGTFTIDSADDSVHGNASVYINNGTFSIASGDDGFHADETLIISAGTIDITESYEGLEALDVQVNGGNISLVASDDGINAAGGTDESGYGGNRGGDMFGGHGGGHGGGLGGSSSSNGSIIISGGVLYIEASGDGIDANGSLSISGGYTTICGPTQGDTATLDYDTSAEITGGTFIGTGASGMAQTFSSSNQGLISLSVGNQSAGTNITIKDSSGNTLVSHEPALSYAVVIVSTHEMVSGESYTVSVGSYTGEFEAE